MEEPVMPADTPITTPVPTPTVATDVLLLLHVPVVGVLPSVVACPTHIDSEPLIVPGSGFTVIVFDAVQPVLKV